MVQFNDWCDIVNTVVSNHHLQVMSCRSQDWNLGVENTATAVPTHYIREESIAHALKTLDKSAAAKIITTFLPQEKKIQSGDLGEIYAAEWINAHSDYRAPIKKLRWKDHRNMAMRGEDVIGMILDPETQCLRFLKTEAKSQISLQKGTLQKMRSSLDKNNGLPSSHALGFIAEKLRECRLDEPLVTAIYNALLLGILPENVKHLLFTFSQDPPNKLLSQALESYTGQICQWGVGLRVDSHSDFVKNVYTRISADDNQP